MVESKSIDGHKSENKSSEKLVKDHSKWFISFLHKFGRTMIELDISNEKELNSLLELVEKEYKDVGNHFLKHGKEREEK